MKLSVDTFLKTEEHEESDVIGRTTLSVGDAAFVELSEIESTLRESTERELMVDLHDRPIDASVPREAGPLKEQQIRVFLDEKGEVGLFHLMAKRSSDEALVYTEPAMIRLVAL